MRNKIVKALVEVFITIAIVLGIISLLMSALSCESKPTKKEIHDKQIKSLFYYEGGPHKNAFHLVSELSNDPRSIENLGCTYVEDTINHTLDVYWEFTAKNAFGGAVREDISFQSDTLGNIIKIY